jgi:hypothetical protein
MAPGGEDQLARSRRRFAKGCVAGSAVGIVCFAWMLTGGSWNFLQRNLFANFYDVQARALLHGHWNVPAAALSIEGIREGGRTYMYYGPVPALLRMPILLVTHRLDGRLTQCSMLVAFVVALFFVGRLSWRIRSLITDAPVSRAEAVLAASTMAIVGVGSQLLYLASDALIYHEAELWGAALALGAFDFVVAFLIRPRWRTLVASSLFSTLAILTRGSVGAGPVVVIGLVGFVLAAATVRGRLAARAPAPVGGGSVATPSPTSPGRLDRGWRWLGLPDVEPGFARTLAVLAAAAVPVLLYVAVNEVKFHTLVSLPLDKQVFTSLNLNRRITLADNGGSLFGLKFIPTALVQYLRPDALRLTRLFPFLGFPGKATVLGNVHYDTLDFSSSLTATMPVFAVLGVVGLAGIFGKRVRGPDRPSLRVLRLPVLGAAVATVGVLAIAFVANRYLADFLPLLVVAGLAGFWLVVAGWCGWRPGLRRAAGFGLVVLALFGVWANVGLALLYQRELRPSAPIAGRDRFVSFQQRIDADLFAGRPPEVIRAAALPRLGAPGALAIVGDCVALYQSDGNEWQAVERSGAGGHFRLQMVFSARAPGGYWPVLVNGARGAGDFLAVHPLGGGRIEFAYLFQGLHQRWVAGTVLRVTPGRPYVVDAVFDPRVNQVTVHVDGQGVLQAVLVRTNRPIAVGRNPLGGPVRGRFPGEIRRLAVTTRTCSALLRRLDDRPGAQPAAAAVSGAGTSSKTYW